VRLGICEAGSGGVLEGRDQGIDRRISLARGQIQVDDDVPLALPQLIDRGGDTKSGSPMW
jgi:hypothetical protein